MNTYGDNSDYKPLKGILVDLPVEVFFTGRDLFLQQKAVDGGSKYDLIYAGNAEAFIRALRKAARKARVYPPKKNRGRTYDPHAGED